MIHLTPREKLIARALCTDRKFAEIAFDLNMRVGTVKNYAGRVYRQMGAKSREHLVGMLLLPLNSPLRREESWQ